MRRIDRGGSGPARAGAALALGVLVAGAGGCMREYQGYLEKESGERVRVYRAGSLFGPVGQPYYFDGIQRVFITDETLIEKDKEP